MDESNEADGGRRRKKMLKSETKEERISDLAKEDRISELPDCLIHHILSFLPSTDEAIRTGILSKRWKNQWTYVPLLILDSIETGLYSPFPKEDFARSIDSTLLQHNCLKVNKLHLAYNFERDANFSSKIRFATTKHVEDLILDCYGEDHGEDPHDSYLLPKLLVDNAYLVKLELSFCYFLDEWIINWISLKAFTMRGHTCRRLIENVLSGCPSLEFFGINPYGGGNGYVFASNSMKNLILAQVDIYDADEIEISCPNLEELTFREVMLPDKSMTDIVSGCPLLRSLELDMCAFDDELVIDSKSLKKLVIIKSTHSCIIEISCPNLEEFNFHGSINETFKLLNIPSIISVTLEAEGPGIASDEDVSKHILDQLQNVKELTIGSLFIKFLSVEMGGLSYPWSNNKILTLDGPNFEHLPGIVCALRSSPMLERLVIKLPVYKDRMTADLPDMNCFQENYWNPNKTVSSCLVLHLRTVKIVDLSKRDAKHKLVLDFIKFLLKNAGVLEKLVIIVSEDQGRDFALEVYKKVSSFPRCAQHAIVEVGCSKSLEM